MMILFLVHSGHCMLPSEVMSVVVNILALLLCTLACARFGILMGIVCMCSCLLGLLYVCCVYQLVNVKEKLTRKKMCLLSTAVTGL
jgi:hypothetical protein